MRRSGPEATAESGPTDLAARARPLRLHTYLDIHTLCCRHNQGGCKHTRHLSRGLCKGTILPEPSVDLPLRSKQIRCFFSTLALAIDDSGAFQREGS